MVTDLAILAALTLVPALLILLLRVNGAIAFMSLCLGNVLVTYTSKDVDTVFTSFTNKDALATNQWAQLALLVAPFLLTVLFTRGHVKGMHKLTNVLPALATGLLFTLLVVPLLPSGVQNSIHGASEWRQLSNAQTAVILAGAICSLIFLLTTHGKKRGGGEEEKKKHGKH